MPDILSILPEIIAALAAGGWFASRYRRKQEAEAHKTEMALKEEEIKAQMRESETKYTREALEIYTQQVVEPLREQLNRNTIAIARYQGAIDMAPDCRLYPDCVIVRCLRKSQKDDRDDAEAANPIQ